MKRRVSHRIASALAGLVATVCLGPCANRAEAASAVLAKDGTLYEVFPTSYGEVIPGANTSDASLRVLALRTTPPGGRNRRTVTTRTPRRPNRG